LAFSQCSNGIYLAFDGQNEFSRVFNFVILSDSRNSQKFDAREKYVLQYAMSLNVCIIITVIGNIMPPAPLKLRPYGTL